MSFRFRRSIKIAPGIRVNFNKNSTSLSLGSKGARYTMSSNGRKTSTIGLPGTGISYTQSTSGKMNHGSKANNQNINAAEIVKIDNDYIESLITIHQSYKNTYDWNAIISTPLPYEKGYGPKTVMARHKMESYIPGFFISWFPKSVESKRRDLSTKYESAIQVEDQYIENLLEGVKVGEGLIRGDKKIRSEVLEEVIRIYNSTDYGSDFNGKFIDSTTVEIDFLIEDFEIVPQKIHTLTPTGRLSEKKMPIGVRMDIIQDFVCSCALHIGSTAIDFLMVKNVLLHIRETIVDTELGQVTERNILSVYMTNDKIKKLNYELIKPSDAIGIFTHNMKFMKTKGLQAIQRLRI